MRKSIAWILVLGLLLMLAACSPEKPNPTEATDATLGGTDATEDTGGTVQEPAGFRVGFARVEITPEESVPLAGYGNTSFRMSDGYLDRIYTICTAITDEDDNTVLLFATDMIRSVNTITEVVRKNINAVTGIPESQILFNASHSHSTPDIISTKTPEIVRYNTKLVKWMENAALAALEDRKPAEMYIGSVQTEGLNFVRHYTLQDGTSVGYESMVTADDPAVAHAGVGDYTMQIVRFVREGGKDVLMANWQAHPTRTGGSTKYDVSADIVGIFRTELENALDSHVTYFQGACGNMNARSLIEDENFKEDYRAQGKAMAERVLNGGDSVFTKVETGKIRAKQISCAGQVDHTYDDMLSYARQVQSIWTSTNNRQKADEAGKPYGIRSPYHANAIISRANLGQISELELDAVSIGDVAFAFAPYEMFAGNGLYIKGHSQFEMTFVVGYANDHVGYIPAIEAFSYLGYETDITRYVEGTGETLAEELVSMLNELYKAG